jgi:hypothetical protein
MGLPCEYWDIVCYGRILRGVNFGEAVVLHANHNSTYCWSCAFGLRYSLGLCSVLVDDMLNNKILAIDAYTTTY